MSRPRRRVSALEVPRALPLSRRRSLVAHHTRLREVAGVSGIRLHLADEVDPAWRATEEALGSAGSPIPFWAFAWAGGLALARYVQEHPDEVAGLRVLDFGTGSGLVAIAAARAGATQVVAADVDPFAEAAVGMNSRANGVHLAYVRRDLLQEPPPEVDVLLAADTWYEGPLAERVLPSGCVPPPPVGSGSCSAIPGGRYLPASGFTELARYDVRTTTLEDRAVLEARVFTLALGQPLRCPDDGTRASRRSRGQLPPLPERALPGRARALRAPGPRWPAPTDNGRRVLRLTIRPRDRLRCAAGRVVRRAERGRAGPGVRAR